MFAGRIPYTLRSVVLMAEYTIITHTDADGVAAAALYAYLQNLDRVELVFTEPYLLDKALRKISEKIGNDKLVVCDLGLNRDTYRETVAILREVAGRATGIEWYDHHVWSGEWIEGLRGVGVVLNIDRSTCATGVVAKYAPRTRSSIDEKFVKELVSGVCAGDLFQFDHWLGPWYLRLIKRRDSDEWRRRVFEVLAKGSLWASEFTERVVESFEAEIQHYNTVEENTIFLEHRGVKIAVGLSRDDAENSFVAAYIIGRFGVDVVALTSLDGKISLRSSNYDVRELAYKLGGGGHPKAAGCKLKIPWKIRLKALVNREILVGYVADELVAAIEGLGGLKRLA